MICGSTIRPGVGASLCAVNWNRFRSEGPDRKLMVSCKSVAVASEPEPATVTEWKPRVPWPSG